MAQLVLQEVMELWVPQLLVVAAVAAAVVAAKLNKH
jgi:hypothetical protein